MIVDNIRFREHCQMWHNQYKEERIDPQPQHRFAPVYSAPPQQRSENRDYRHWQQRQKTASTSSSNGSFLPQTPHPQASTSWTDNRNKSIDSSRSTPPPASSFPPRRTLIDTFVERNDDYWRNRVTIKIDVAFTDHSHVIGKQGRNTQTVMKETGCHIHFPDANRNPDMEKSNMVSIAGPMKSVDDARRAIRDLAPLVITLEMKHYFDDPNVLSEDPLLQEISVIDGVNVLVRTNRSSGTPFFVIRGSIYQTKAIRDAVIRLQQRFMKTTKALCSTALDVLKPQQPTVLGVDGSNIQSISQRTRAKIYYPRGDVGAATTFFIQGTIDAILSARQHVIGCLPMSFAFEIQKENVEMMGLDGMQREFGLSIGVRSSRNGEAQMIIVKGQERQATSMYAVRRLLVGDTLPDEPPVIASDYVFMKDFGVPSFIPSPDIDTGEATGSILHSANGSAAMTTSAVFTFQSPFAVMPFSPVSPFPFLPNPVECHRYFNYHYDVGAGSSGSTVTPFDNEKAYHQPSTAFDANAGAHSAPADAVTRLTHFDPPPDSAPLASGLLEAAKKFQETRNDWKAPGAERGANVDYDKQQLLATKAMREQPRGPRVPNDHWSGLGFSRSMPSKQEGGKVVKAVDERRLENVDEEADDNKIGPWTMTPAVGLKKGFNTTTYFDHGGASVSLKFSEGDDVSILLSKLHLIKYVDVFREQEVDMGTFLTMTDSDLKELGVNTFGARRKLLVAISELKENRRRGQ